MLEIVFFALVEELIKLGIVLLFRNTWFRVPSYFVFFAAECAMKWGDVYPHSLALGASGGAALAGSVSVIVGSSLFHVFTSILYGNVRHIWPTLAFCTVLHAGWNYGVEFLPAFRFFWYVTGPWIEALLSGALIFAYWRLQRRGSITQLDTSNR